MIRLEGVSRLYGSVAAVRDLSLEVLEGELCVLVGPSGCGKTTTLRMVNRLVEPTSGRVLVGGRDVRTIPPAELRRGMGYAIQSVGLFGHLTVGENVAVVPDLLGWPRARVRARVTELLERVGLPPERYRDAWPRELSGGQAQRVGVARALAADPPVLLMDEPFGAVDPLTRERLQDEFSRLQRELGKTVLLVTHDMDEAIKLADRVVLMRDGRIEQAGPPEQLLESPATRFARDFVGADRGLKRLSRVRVRDAMRADAPRVPSDAPLASALALLSSGGPDSAWVVDGSGVLLGWLEAGARGRTLEDAMAAHDWREVAIVQDASVREALSRMVGEGIRTLAVVDATGRLLGEIGLPDVERLSARRAPPTGGAAQVEDRGRRDAARNAGGRPPGAPSTDRGKP